MNKPGKSMRLVFEDLASVADMTVADPNPADSKFL